MLSSHVRDLGKTTTLNMLADKLVTTNKAIQLDKTVVSGSDNRYTMKLIKDNRILIITTPGDTPDILEENKKYMLDYEQAHEEETILWVTAVHHTPHTRGCVWSTAGVNLPIICLDKAGAGFVDSLNGHFIPPKGTLTKDQQNLRDISNEFDVQRIMTALDI